MADNKPFKVDVKIAPGPRFPTAQEMSFADLIREYVMILMDTTPGSTPKKLELLAAEINNRAEQFSAKKVKKTKVSTTPPSTEA